MCHELIYFDGKNRVKYTVGKEEVATITLREDGCMATIRYNDGSFRRLHGEYMEEYQKEPETPSIGFIKVER